MRLIFGVCLTTNVYLVYMFFWVGLRLIICPLLFFINSILFQNLFELGNGRGGESNMFKLFKKSCFFHNNGSFLLVHGVI